MNPQSIKDAFDRVFIFVIVNNYNVFDFEDLYSIFEYKNSKKSDILNLLKKTPALFKIIEYDGKNIVEVKKSPFYCYQYNSKDGCQQVDCRFFHICSRLFTKQCDSKICGSLDHDFNSDFKKKQVRMKNMVHIDINQFIIFYQGFYVDEKIQKNSRKKKVTENESKKIEIHISENFIELQEMSRNFLYQLFSDNDNYSMIGGGLIESFDYIENLCKAGVVYKDIQVAERVFKKKIIKYNEYTFKIIRPQLYQIVKPFKKNIFLSILLSKRNVNWSNKLTEKLKSFNKNNQVIIAKRAMIISVDSIFVRDYKSWSNNFNKIMTIYFDAFKMEILNFIVHKIGSSTFSDKFDDRTLMIEFEEAIDSARNHKKQGYDIDYNVIGNEIYLIGKPEQVEQFFQENKQFHSLRNVDKIIPKKGLVNDKRHFNETINTNSLKSFDKIIPKKELVNKERFKEIINKPINYQNSENLDSLIRKGFKSEIYGNQFDVVINNSEIELHGFHKDNLQKLKNIMKKCMDSVVFIKYVDFSHIKKPLIDKDKLNQCLEESFEYYKQYDMCEFLYSPKSIYFLYFENYFTFGLTQVPIIHKYHELIHTFKKEKLLNDFRNKWPEFDSRIQKSKIGNYAVFEIDIPKYNQQNSNKCVRLHIFTNDTFLIQNIENEFTKLISEIESSFFGRLFTYVFK